MDTSARISQTIATEIGAAAKQVSAAVALLDEGATVPFVARYRKEATGGLDDTQLRTLAERLEYLRELEKRRAAILDSIKGQDKLTDDLAASIAKAETKAQLEDIYLPYKPKRRTKAMIAPGERAGAAGRCHPGRPQRRPGEAGGRVHYRGGGHGEGRAEWRAGIF